MPGWGGHPFGYVDGNPVNLVDPLGLFGNPFGGNPLEKLTDRCSWVFTIEKACDRGEEIADELDDVVPNSMSPRLIGEYVRDFLNSAGVSFSACADAQCPGAYEAKKYLAFKTDACAATEGCSPALAAILLHAANATPSYLPEVKIGFYVAYIS